MHQIIHLSPMGCFTPARGKTVQKNREVSGVKAILSLFLNILHILLKINIHNNCRNYTLQNYYNELYFFFIH